ncbi:zf-HC2 domain-containing protein [Streptomyces sp. DSM 44915]|uniref:Zf-HC2 domain-containing protein n=1 Tax=Streptomyces chisholmiae TaxID=3075540 RepID=A0ABU2JRP1_9ACTN|nr:zf-HC2 domain-containing protein [Streptomyces sp. DSM 44915]MDT0266903.1 zf-HC2 domain-containing protein [Streptomyces sp. DSM 44915]
MACNHFRSAISARATGTPLPATVTEQALDHHLTSCLSCSRWSKHLTTLRAATDDILRRRRPAGAPQEPV